MGGRWRGGREVARWMDGLSPRGGEGVGCLTVRGRGGDDDDGGGRVRGAGDCWYLP